MTEKTPLQQVVENIKSMEPEKGLITRIRFHTLNYRSYVSSTISWEHHITQQNDRIKVVHYQLKFIDDEFHEVTVTAYNIHGTVTSSSSTINIDYFKDTKWLKEIRNLIDDEPIYDKMSSYL